MALTQQDALNQITAQLASSKDGGYLEKIHKQLSSKGVSGNDPFMGFKVPQLTDVAKGLFFGLAPGLVKKSVDGMQVFVDALNGIKIPDADASLKIAKVIDNFSGAIINFGNISWTKAFKGTFLIEKFSNRFIKLGEILGSPENIKRLAPFKKFAKTFGEPLKLIGQGLSYFDKIKWVKMFFGTKIFEKLIVSFVKIGKLAARNSDSFKSFGEILTNLNEPLTKFGETFEKIGNGLIKASLSLLIVAGSLGLAAISLQQFGNVNLSDVIKGFGALGIMVVTLKLLSKSSGDAIKSAAALAIVAGSLGLTAISLKLFSNGIVWPQVLGGVAALGVMALGLKLLSKGSTNMIKGAAAIAIVGASLGIAALSFKLFSGIDFGSVLAGVGILTGIMIGLVAMGALLTGPQLGFVAIAAGIMALVGAAMIPFALGLKILGGVNWKGFDGIFTALSKLAAGTALLSLAIPGMLAFAITGIPFALGMMLLSKVKWDAITKSGEALKSFASGAALLALAIPGMLGFAIAAIPFSAGIVALRLAIGKDDKISTFLEKFNKGLKDLKGDSLISAAKGILALSGALVSFAGAQVLSGVGTLIGKILRFGSDSPIDQLIKLAKHGYNLSILGTGVAALAAGLKTLTGIDSELSILETLADKFKAFDSLDPTGIKAFAEGLNMLVDALTSLSQLDGKLNVLNDIPFDKLKDLTQSVKPGAPLIQIVNGLQESNESKQTAELLRQSISSNAPTVGSQLRESGSSINAPTVVINNNTGGNVTNNSSTSSNVNNNGSTSAPIITASGSGMFTAE